MRFILVFTASLCFSLGASAQKIPQTKAELDSVYAVNITKSRLYNVYIPRDLWDAHKRILKLTPKDAILKFKDGPEKAVCEKLHFGIGRWIIHNWNFYEGSRLSHYLKKKGVLHPDDMAQFILRTLHRDLNDVELEEEKIIEELAIGRKAEAKRLLDN